MKKIGIIRCGRYEQCSGSGCFAGVNDLSGPMAQYNNDGGVQVVGYTTCGGCPGANMEKAPIALQKAGAEVIHLATCFLCGVPPCIHLRDFMRLITTLTGLPVVVGTHSFPKTYYELHEKLGDWKEMKLLDLAQPLFPQDKATSLSRSKTKKACCGG